VGPAGEEIYTDQFGRVKVRFHWDREDKKNENSSCWIRVAQLWAGKKWGSVFIPRVGQEVVVEFLEGDPDQPLVTGRVYNGVQMPPYALPGECTKSTIKTNTVKGEGFNEIRFDDKKGEEQIFIHAQKNLDVRVKENEYKTIEKEVHLVVEEDQLTHIKNKRHETIDSDATIKIGGDHHLKITGKQAIKIGGSCSLQVNGPVAEVFDQSHSEKVSLAYYLKAMSVVIESDRGMTFKCGGNSVVIDALGVTLKGNSVVLDGIMTRINSGPGSPAMSGAATSLVSPSDPNGAHDADTADPGEMAALKATQIEQKRGKYGETKFKPHKPAAAVEAGAEEAQDNGKKKTFIEIQLEDKEGKPVPGEPYRIVLPDGSTAAEGTLNEKGFARVDEIDPGICQVTFPNREKKAWRRK
jgi:type VI secretion system secreted protein VgrG